MIEQRLAALRAVMKEQNVQAVIIPTSDFHDTEYVCEHFAARAYFSGFTGSAGTLVVLQDGGGLWTDGRYFIQAARQLEGSGIVLEKLNEPGTPSIPGYLIEHLSAGDTAAVDGRTISFKQYETWRSELKAHDIDLKVDEDLPGMAWPERPELPATRTFTWDEKYAGESTSSKLARVREAIAKENAKSHITSKIDETAWLFNLRADDIPCFPAFLSYALIEPDKAVLYMDDSRLDDQSRTRLEKDGVEIRGYEQIYEDAPMLEEAVLVDENYLNSKLGASLKKPVWKKNPITPMKALKNKAEQEGARRAHIKDGAAVVKFWKWLEDSLKAGKVIDEQDAVEKVHEFRAQQPDFLEDSFDAISAWGPNAAMPHYHATRDNCAVIEPKGLYLLDSGGQYLDGTTDITRTFVVGDLDEEERNSFTRVLQGHINLANAKFKKGTRGYNLDVLTRMPLWLEMQDFNHGTGHGVGALSSVHEGPNSYYWLVTPTRNGSTVLEEGMITSDEPGLYIEGKYGIRHENLLLTKELGSNEYGDWYGNEVLTMVPFDVRGLDLDLMSPTEKAWLNAYHQEVFDKISPLLEEEEVEFLKEKTRPVA